MVILQYASLKGLGRDVRWSYIFSGLAEHLPWHLTPVPFIVQLVLTVSMSIRTVSSTRPSSMEMALVREEYRARIVVASSIIPSPKVSDTVVAPLMHFVFSSNRFQ